MKNSTTTRGPHSWSLKNLLCLLFVKLSLSQHGWWPGAITKTILLLFGSSSKLLSSSLMLMVLWLKRGTAPSSKQRCHAWLCRSFVFFWVRCQVDGATFLHSPTNVGCLRTWVTDVNPPFFLCFDNYVYFLQAGKAYTKASVNSLVLHLHLYFDSVYSHLVWKSTPTESKS